MANVGFSLIKERFILLKMVVQHVKDGSSIKDSSLIKNNIV